MHVQDPHWLPKAKNRVNFFSRGPTHGRRASEEPFEQDAPPPLPFYMSIPRLDRHRASWMKKGAGVAHLSICMEKESLEGEGQALLLPPPLHFD